MSKELLYWMGSLGDCDICQSSFGEFMYDAKTNRGPWGNLCSTCYMRFGVGLGPGLGQKYQKQPDGRWLKVEG